MIRFLDEHLPHDQGYTFVIMVCSYNNQWVWVRHKERSTWELPAGHVESGETADEASVRELYEETGATGYTMEPVCSYQGSYQNRTVFGKIYRVIIQKLSAIPDSEIAEVSFLDKIPESLTYPDIQPLFFRRVSDGSNSRG